MSSVSQSATVNQSPKGSSPFVALWAVFLFVVLLAFGYFLHGKVTQTLYYGSFSVTQANGPTLRFLQQGDLSSSACQARIGKVLNAYRNLCPQCQVQPGVCTSSISDLDKLALSEAPIDVPSSRTAGGGVLLYLSDSSQSASALCNEVAKNSNTMNCSQAGEARPLPAADFSAGKANMRPDRALELSLYAIAAFLILVAAVARFKMRRASAAFSRSIYLQKLFLAGVDIFSMVFAYYLVGLPGKLNPVQLYQYDLRQMALQAFLVLAVVGWLWVYYQHYTRRRPLWDELRELFKTLVAATLISGTALFYSRIEGERNLILWGWVFCFLLVPVGRVAARQVLHWFGLWMRPVLIIGTGANAIDAFKAIQSEFALGYQVIGFVETESESLSTSHLEIKGEFYRKYAYGEEFSGTLERLSQPQLVVALETLASAESQQVLHKLTFLSENIHVIPTLRGLPLFGASMSHFFSHEVVFLTLQNNLSRRSYFVVKRIFDIVGSSVLLVLLSPLLLYVAIKIYLEDGGPVIFSQPRVAYGKQSTFKFYKFRSMVNGADQILAEWKASNSAEWQNYNRNNFKLANDPRVLKIGTWIRKTSIDELPQLFNVLMGDMSLVGPRPLLERELPNYGLNIQLYKQARPGITGLWQVSGRSQTKFADRVHLDQWYVQNWSMWYDIAILFKTLAVVFKKDGAF